MSIISRFDAINSRSRHPPKPAGNCNCCADEAQKHQEPVAVEQTQPENRNDDHGPRRREWHEFERRDCKEQEQDHDTGRASPGRTGKARQALVQLRIDPERHRFQPFHRPDHPIGLELPPAQPVRRPEMFIAHEKAYRDCCERQRKDRREARNAPKWGNLEQRQDGKGWPVAAMIERVDEVSSLDLVSSRLRSGFLEFGYDVSERAFFLLHADSSTVTPP